jgi:transketolase
LPQQRLAAADIVTVAEMAAVGCNRYATSGGTVVDMRAFGAPSRIEVVAEAFGFMPERLAGAAQQALGRA